jgi:hypothetical protein
MCTSYSSISELNIHSYNCKYLNLPCNCVPLERVYNIKYLGINFDHRLKFVDHIYSVNNSIRKLFYKFKILRNILDLKTLRVVFLALAQSIYLYGSLVWGCTYSSHINVLCTTIKSLIKVILNKPRFFSSNLLYTILNVQPFRISYERQTLLYMYKIRNLLKAYQPSHDYYTRLKNNNNLNIPHNKTNFGNQNTIISGVLLLKVYNINVFSFINYNQYKNHVISVLVFYLRFNVFVFWNN